MTILFWLVVIAGALYLLAGLGIFLLACRRFPADHDPMRRLTHATDKILAPYDDVMQAGRQWLEAHPSVPVEMTSFDGLTLRGELYEHPQAKALLIACHGYRSNGVRDFASACRFYYDYGISILLIDQRAAGRSGGKYITFGVRESVDVRDWCSLMAERFPGLPIVLAGISMGASSVLMAADDLPENVAALLADCGYTSPWEEFSHVARHYMGRAALALLPGVDVWCRLLGGFGLKERSAPRALEKNTRPVLFIHGQADELVPYEHSLKNRDACRGTAELFSVPGADHGMSYLVDPEGYHETAERFLTAYIFAK